MEMSNKGNYISNEKVTIQQSKYLENVLCTMQGKTLLWILKKKRLRFIQNSYR